MIWLKFLKDCPGSCVEETWQGWIQQEQKQGDQLGGLCSNPEQEVEVEVVRVVELHIYFEDGINSISW